VNTAGVPWQNVQALRRKGVDAKLVVFERYKLHPEADWSLDRHGGLFRQQLTQARAFARLLPQTDVFHFYFGLTLVPKSLQFPLLRAKRKRSVMHFLGSDIRGKPPAALAWAKRAGARIVGSYDAIRWVPDAEVVPPGIDLSEYAPRAPAERERPIVVHAPSSRRRKGTEDVIAACAPIGPNARPSTARRICLPMPRPRTALTRNDAESTVRNRGKSLPSSSCAPTNSSSTRTAKLRRHDSGCQVPYAFQ